MATKNTPSLTIAVPTFNREQHLRRQLDFLLSEPAIQSRNARVLVSNNCSSDGTRRLLDEYQARVPHWTFVHQPRNLGLVGNVRFCLEACESDYLWLVSDDDILRPNTVSHVLELLRSARPGLLHLGWGIVSPDKLEVLAEHYYGFNVMIHPSKGHEAFVRITQTEHLGMSFITSNIMRADLAKEALREWRGAADNLALPLFLSAYCSYKGGFYFEKESWVYGRTGAVSWSAMADRFAFYDLLLAYQSLRGLGFSRKRIISKHLRLVLLSPSAARYYARHPLHALRVWALAPLRLLR